MPAASPPEVVITEFMDQAAVADLRSHHRVLYEPDLVDRPDDLAAALPGARGLVVRNRTRVDASLLDAAPHLEVVGRLGVGLDNIDLAACRARGVAVCPATGANAVAVAEYVMAALLILFRGAYRASARVVAGEWPRTELLGREIAGKRLGLLGLGAIGLEVATRAAAFGMAVAAHDPYRPAGDPAWAHARPVPSVAELLAGSDAVSLHVPLTPETANVVDAAAIAGMPPGAVLVNTARGGIVDEEALVAALRSGHLGGAALDAFAVEPVNEAGGARFAGVPNLLLTPHVAGISVEANRRVSAVTAANVLRVLAG